RSDQYSFIKVGIPALAMKVAYEPNSPEAEIARKWTAERYHAPSDDLSQPTDRSAAAKYVEVVRDLAIHIANRAESPTRNGACSFKRFATAATNFRHEKQENTTHPQRKRLRAGGRQPQQRCSRYRACTDRSMEPRHMTIPLGGTIGWGALLKRTLKEVSND